MSVIKQSRRNFLKMTGIAGGGLILGTTLNGCSSTPQPAYASEQDSFDANAFLQITSDNQIRFYMHHAEMGQGIYHGLTTLIAEELEVVPEKIDVRFAGIHEDYENPAFGVQGTGGSTSMITSFVPIRKAAATAREQLRAAAAQMLEAPIDELEMRAGSVHWQGKAYDYGQFANAASVLPTPRDVSLKPKEKFTQIGKDRPRLDAVAKSTGTADFGIDIDIPNLHRAALVRSPVHGGSVKSFDATEAKAMPGVKSVVQVESGVAVVAESYWQARKAADALKIDWSLPELAHWSSAEVYKDFKEALDREDGNKSEKSGDGAQALTKAAKVIEADYYTPYLAHSTMETPNCTVRLTADHCEVWAGCQSPSGVLRTAAMHAGLQKDQITVHQAFLGGAFGRRSISDYVAEAVQIAKASGIAAVQLVWSREDDIRHDWYRPASMARLQAGLDDKGQLQCWNVKRVGPNLTAHILDSELDSMLYGVLPAGAADWASKRGYPLFENWIIDPDSVKGLAKDYDSPNKEVRHVTRDPGLRIGYWRSVSYSFSGFFQESFMDELAEATNRDPLEIRLAHTDNNPRLKKVLEAVAAKANWGTPSAPGRYQGVAAQASFESYVAQVAEVSVDNNQIKVHKIYCAVDCGLAVNPDVIKAQMEGSIIFGLTAALHGEIMLEKGAVQQSNFHDYPLLRMNEAPEIEVIIIDSQEAPGGVGEPGMPPLAPAVANAVFAATGQRLRSLPLKLA